MPELNKAEEFIWKWRRGPMSDFRRALIHVIQRADVHNLEKLRKGFPDEVEGYCSYRLIPGWWDALEAKIAKSLCDSCGLDKHGCIEAGARYAQIDKCANHEPKEATP